ncbi:MAG: metalloregulator ArsR/SmtB family transcription factor [Oscillospiraceae bacterium]|nr:metalloregulator ArsR/SmtB family transcription factor [Oscillospiraceae bacterium]
MKHVQIFKALSDNTRFKIILMLSHTEKMCACKILEKFEITQPTLSHHMKILSECELVNTEKIGKWSHYSLNRNTISEFKQFINNI